MGVLTVVGAFAAGCVLTVIVLVLIRGIIRAEVKKAAEEEK